MRNKLYFGDNLNILQQHIDDESIDLVYLDPPFNSNRDYNVLFRDQSGEHSPAQIKAFTDTWNWAGAAAAWEEFPEICPLPRVIDLMSGFIETLGKNDVTAYLIMMAPRLYHLHRVLKPTGSLYLHCDTTAGAYLKLLLDAVFGPKNFRNEIVWRRTGSHNSRRSFGRIHDTIYFYVKSRNYRFNVVRRPYMKEHVEKRYKADEDGRLRFSSGGNVLTGDGATGGMSCEPWQGFNPASKGRHWAIPSFYEEHMPEEYAKYNTIEKLDALYEAGLIEIVDGAAWPIMVRYLEERDGSPIQDIWAYQPYTKNLLHGTTEGIDEDVAWLGPTDPDRLGYDTQKPLGLLERIVLASSEKGELILDPFCGCGTAVAAAEKLGRKWIGIDITPLATSLIQKRLWDNFQAKDVRLLAPGDPDAMRARAFEVTGLPTDVAGARMLFESDHKNFEMWAVGLVPAIPQEKKGADRGIDGFAYFHDGNPKPSKAIVQVKGGHVSSQQIRDLRGTKERERAALALFICLEPATKAMRAEALEAGFYQPPIGGKKVPAIQIRTINEMLNGKPFELPFTGSNVSYFKTKAIPMPSGQMAIEDTGD